MKRIYILIVGFVLFSMHNYAQQDTNKVYPPSPPAADNKVRFKLSGYSSFDFVMPQKSNGSFAQSTFAPIFTWRQSDKLFFQAEVEYVSEGGNYDGGFELEFATMNYMANKHMTIYAGKFLGPLGTFQARYHPAWINKSITRPIGFGTSINDLKRLEAGSEAGAGVQGIFQLGKSKLTYNFYVANGAILDTTTGNMEMESLSDNNYNKALGGRIALLPFSSSSLEIGLSGYTSKVGDIGSGYENLSTNIVAVDLNYVKHLSIGTIDIKGEWQRRTLPTGTRYYASPSDTVGFTYNNSPSVMYAQLAYRFPKIGQLKWTNDFELVGRFSEMKVDKKSTYGLNTQELSVGLNYWLNFSTVIKAGWVSQTFTDFNRQSNMFVVQAAMGF